MPDMLNIAKELDEAIDILDPEDILSRRRRRVVRLRLIDFWTFFRAALGEGCIESRVIGRVYVRCSQEGKDSTHPHGVGQHARGRFQLASRYGRLGRSVGRFQLGFLPDPTHPTSIEHPPTCDCALTKGHPLLLGSCTSVSSRYQSEHPALKGL